LINCQTQAVLVERARCRRHKVHDAWLVAAMKAHGMNRIFTFNASDFARYDGIEGVDPKAP
jgi:predicted nucleic acid-binding protein